MPRTIARIGLFPLLALLAPAADAQPARWSVTATPTVTIGSDPDATEFISAVAGATRLPNGNILVGDRGDYSLVLFDTKGTVLRKFARKGKGPGEVTSIGTDRFLRCGNRIAVMDGSTRQVSLFDLNGAYLSRFRFSSLPYRYACNDNARFVMYEWERSSDMQKGAYRATIPYWIRSTDSTRGVSLGNLPGSERFGATPLGLGREPRVAISTNRAYVALGDSMHILTFELNGKPMPPLRTPYRPIETTDADWKDEIERTVALVGEQARPAVNQMFKDQPRPRFLPATRDLIVDADQNVWVQHYPIAGQSMVTWSVFAPSGQVRATVQLPAKLEVYEIGREYVLGRYVNPESELAEVRQYKLTRTR